MSPPLNLSDEQKKCLREIAARICQPGKGVLATDDTAGDLGARIEKLGGTNSAESRRAYRQILYTTPFFSNNLTSVILIEETFKQSTDNGRSFVSVLKDQNQVVGVQADMGTEAFEGGAHGETHSRGLDTLDARLAEYAKGGAQFAKWRAALVVGNGAPTDACLRKNAQELAEYAAACQRHQLVPFVEPDVLVAAGTHSLDEAKKATQRALEHTFAALAEHNVYLEGIVLKPNMVSAGADAAQRSSPDEVARATVDALRHGVPSAVPGCVFLSGGQTPLQATQNLNAIGKLASAEHTPWYLTFCYGRAIQGPVMEAWNGKKENVKAAQKILLHRARANGDAQRGAYAGEEKVASEIAQLAV